MQNAQATVLAESKAYSGGERVAAKVNQGLVDYSFKKVRREARYTRVCQMMIKDMADVFH